MKRAISLLFTLVMLLSFTTGATARDKVVNTEGSSSLSRGDAIRQAQRSAVEEAVGVFIRSKTEIENFILKKDIIYARTQGYITRFTVLTEGKDGDIFKVRIRATVSLDKIKDDLLAMKILLESMERPKVMVLIEEDYKNMDNMGMEITGTEISRLLGDKGFDLVDKAMLEAVKNRDQARQALAGNTAAGRILGLQLGAQYVVLGKAVAQDAGEAYPGCGLKSLQASLQLKLIQSQTGLVLGSVVKNGVAAHISPLTGATMALKKTAKKTVDEFLVDTITKSFQDFLNNGAPLKLHVTGVKAFQQYKLIVSTIETTKRVVNAKKEGWNKAGGLLVLDLRFKGTSEELADLLDGRRLGNNSLEVVDFAPERVDCIFR